MVIPFEVKTVETKVFLHFLCLLMEGSWILIRTIKLRLRIRIQEAKKHTGSGTLLETCVSTDLLNRIVLLF
jgi:hypothetical protein